MNTEKKIDELLGSVNGENESLFINYVNGNDCMLAFTGDYEAITESLKSMIRSSINGNSPADARLMAAAIVNAVNEAISELLGYGAPEEDCENCELNRVCDSESAIKYRKEHGVPKPRKNKKGGRKVNVN